MGVRNQFWYFDPKKDMLCLSIWGMIFMFPESERNHALSYALSDEFDLGMQNIIFNTLKSGDCFVDIGASVGVLTTIGARKVGALGKVIAYEPIPKLAKACEFNVKNNAPNIKYQIFNSCAFNEKKNVSLNVYEMDSRISTAYSYDAESLNPNDFVKIDVETRILDEDLADFQHVDLVKIDAEGAELPILKGMHSTIAANPQIKIILEWSQNHFERAGYGGKEIIEFLSKFDMEIFGIDPITGNQIGFDPVNFEGNIIAQKKLNRFC